jgi:hypothetical protein
VSGHPKCALGRIQIDQMDTEKVKREGWLNEGILVVLVDDPRLDFVEREFVRQIGKRLYEGKGRGA